MLGGFGASASTGSPFGGAVMVGTLDVAVGVAASTASFIALENVYFQNSVLTKRNEIITHHSNCERDCDLSKKNLNC